MAKWTTDIMKKVTEEVNKIPITDKERRIAAWARSKKPVIIVEGPRDEKVYGWIDNVIRERQKPSQMLPVEPVRAGNKDKLLDYYNKIKDMEENVPVIFIADKDMEVFKSNPTLNSDIIWTTGYCLENDIYAGVKLTTFLTEEESKLHNEMLMDIIDWFALGAEMHLRNVKYPPRLRVDELSDLFPDGKTLNPTQKPYIRHERDDLSSENLEKFNILKEKIKKNYSLYLPGKLLFLLLTHFTEREGRKPKITNSFLLEIAFKVPMQHQPRDELIKKIKCKYDEALKKIKSKGKSTSSTIHTE